MYLKLSEVGLFSKCVFIFLLFIIHSCIFEVGSYYRKNVYCYSNEGWRSSWRTATKRGSSRKGRLISSQTWTWRRRSRCWRNRSSGPSASRWPRRTAPSAPTSCCTHRTSSRQVTLLMDSQSLNCDPVLRLLMNL